MKIKKINREGTIKLSLSLSLLIYSFIVAIITKSVFLFVGMLASSLGDIYIMSSRGVFNDTKNYDGFDYGVVFFSIAHFFYMMAMMSEYTPFLLIVVVVAMLMIMNLVFRMGFRDYKWTNVCYAACIFCDFINTWSFHWLAAVGLGFFITSDIILSLKEKDKPIWQVPVWITYVIAQILVITSFLLKK